MSPQTAPILEIDLESGLASASEITCDWSDPKGNACPAPAYWLGEADCPVRTHSGRMCTPHKEQVVALMAESGWFTCPHGFRMTVLRIRPI